MLWVLIRMFLSLIEAILMNTHNICFYGELTKIVLELSSNILLVCSTVMMIDCLKYLSKY